MTDPQLPPPSGAVPPVPPAPTGAVPPPPVAPPYPAPPTGPAYPTAPAAEYAVAPTAYSAPPGAYQVPVGGYTQQAGGYAVPDAAPRKSGLLGILALLFSLVAAVVTPIVVGVATYEIGRRIPEAATRVDDFDSLAWLSPARDQVLWAELAFWTGTILGIVAIVIGILAIVRKQGRGQGIAALIVSAVGPVIFFLVVLVALTLGGAAGTAGLYS
ncbi:hypothetical protein [Microbacterium sp. NPDC087591]|uniref:hypothetical protein n=1 Tax=Microbacterium sp. NPDC087591 TaxID=3364192 RepID=UPI003820A932